MDLVTTCPAVVCCRCSPEQKAQVVRLIQQHTGKRTAAIGDGGNDVVSYLLSYIFSNLSSVLSTFMLLYDNFYIDPSVFSP